MTAAEASEFQRLKSDVRRLVEQLDRARREIDEIRSRLSATASDGFTTEDVEVVTDVECNDDGTITVTTRTIRVLAETGEA